MIMPCHCETVEGPAVMQLRKWSELQVELNISEFCEAFLSPTRELLLLLSYQSEALLLPLAAGEESQSTSVYADDSEKNSFEHQLMPSTSSFSSIDRTTTSMSGQMYVTPSSSEPVHTVPNVVVSQGRCSTYKPCPVVCDVKSLAWGYCGDAYKQSCFRELLVVAGNRGVFIHCFRNMDKNNETIKSANMDGLVEGRWVDWGPSAASTDNLQSREQLGTKGFDSFCGMKQMVGREAHYDSSDSCFTSKCWLQSFLAAVETTKSEGNFLARFPVKSSLPPSAVVVSFAVIFRAPIFLDFLSCANTVSNANKEDAAMGEATDNSLSPFTCSHLFSNSSHHLIGLVLTLPEHVQSGDTQATRCEANKIVVVVAMIHEWGIQWLFPVHLPDYSPELGPTFEWMDFKFSENYLLCLSSLGLVLAWGSTTGKLVARLDIIQCCGMNVKLEFAPVHSMLCALTHDSSDVLVEREKVFHGKISQLAGDRLPKTIFKKLMVAFNCPQFAAVDDYGIVYVFCEDDFDCEENHWANQLSCFYHGQGLLAGWMVAGSETGSQRVLSDPSRAQCSNVLLEKKDKLSSTSCSSDVKPWVQVKHHMQRYGDQCGSSQKQTFDITSTDVSSIHIRRVLLPVYCFDRTDSICFSSFGITRLTNKCDVKGQKGFKIVHSPLTMASSVLDDGGLHSSKYSRKCTFLKQETAFPGQAIGFSFQGSFYVTTQDGLSIVLPLVSSSILPGESLKYWQPILNSCGGNQMQNFWEIKDSREQWLPWKLEVLDRTLLCESPEEADHICLENGWDLKIARLRRLHLALDYLKYDEIERSLEKLVDINMAEEGILRLLFTSVYQISCKAGNDNGVALALRFLALAASFATKMIRKYGLLKHQKERFIHQGVKRSKMLYLQQTISRDRTMSDINNSRRLQETAYFLEIIRNLQEKLRTRHIKPGQQAV